MALGTDAVFVEVARFMVVLLCTAAGYHLLGGAAAASTGHGALVGACLGAGIGYVQGGVVGRALETGLATFRRVVGATEAAALLAGAVGATVVGGLGLVVGAVSVSLLPNGLGWPVLGLLAWTGVFAGYQVGAAKGSELVGLLTEGGARTRVGALGPVPDGPLVLVDSSAAIDGRFAATAGSGFLPGRLAVPRFVLDELQGIADAADPIRRRRGRRALEALAAGQDEPSIGLVVLEDEVPERVEVDAKLVVLADRYGAALLTTDTNLRRVAELRGVRCLDPAELARSLLPVLVPGETVRVTVSKPGRDAGQGVGFLEDGTMVVVNDGGERLGDDVQVTISSSVQTSKGRMFFASVAG